MTIFCFKCGLEHAKIKKGMVVHCGCGQKLYPDFIDKCTCNAKHEIHCDYWVIPRRKK